MTPEPPGSFDDLVPQYDRYRVGYADELYEALADYGLRRGVRVVDVGCGTGLVSAALAARGCSVVGVDTSEPMLARARERAPGAVFQRARAEDLPFRDASFGGAVSAQAFHWFDQRRALHEMTRVVSPGGTIGIWWKALMRGDTTRLIREEIACEIGLTPPRDLLTLDFEAFDDSPLIDRRLRVIPWILHTTVGEYLGYERSRKRARDAFGTSSELYLARLSDRLGAPWAAITLGYVHLLYLGRVPSPDGAGR